MSGFWMVIERLVCKCSWMGSKIRKPNHLKTNQNSMVRFQILTEWLKGIQNLDFYLFRFGMVEQFETSPNQYSFSSVWTELAYQFLIKTVQLILHFFFPVWIDVEMMREKSKLKSSSLTESGSRMTTTSLNITKRSRFTPSRATPTRPRARPLTPSRGSLHARPCGTRPRVKWWKCSSHFSGENYSNFQNNFRVKIYRQFSIHSLSSLRLGPQMSRL